MSPDRFKFEPATLPPHSYSYQWYMSTHGLSKADAKKQVQRCKDSAVYLSDTYEVREEVEGPYTRLSIKRIDKEAFHDWRELQSIKNAILGPEIEAVELYPAESRLVDTANQYWLFALPAGVTFNFGFRERLVEGPEEAEKVGAKQRAFTY